MQTLVETKRLALRRLATTDASTVRKLAGDREVAAATSNIPHPYPEGVAEKWIAQTHERLDQKEGGALAVTFNEKLVGVVGLVNVVASDERGEVGYWIGKPYWGNGYCTEAVLGMIDFVKTEFGLTRLDARCFATNIGSRRVLEKAGFVYEGKFSQHVRKCGKFEDVLFFGLVHPERQTT